MVNQDTIRLIDTFTSKIPLVRICQYLNISRSTYYYHKKHADHFNLNRIEQEIQQLCIKTKFLYGYRIKRKKGAIRSMYRKGTPVDNAIIESFHANLKTEMIHTS
ncbi:hypothetical protein AKUH1B302M_01260 [Apilactobacillus kunkeei]|nr:hypothetical protein AKUH1B302M_01260 [Apilactobacillus kunkeei]